MELANAFDHAIGERNTCRGLLTRYLAEHDKVETFMAGDTLSVCRCAICRDTRLALEKMTNAHPY